MEPIADFSWMKDLLTGRVRERFPLEPYRIVGVEIPLAEEARPSQYHYRLLVFPPEGNKPVLALNLETSLLGSPCLTEQAGSEHLVLGEAEESMSYEEFRRWAVARARRELKLN
jgi:hypothetical protein